MIVKTIELFGKPLFNWVTISQPVKMTTTMPENEAGFVFVLKGGCINHTEIEKLQIMANQAVLAKCGNSTFTTLSVDGSTEYSSIVIKFHKEVLEKIYKNTASPFLPKTDCPLTVNTTTVETNELLNQYINGLVSYFDHPELVSEELLKLKLNEIIVLLLQTENAPRVLGIMNHLFEKKTFEFKEVIKAHIFSPLSIRELAQLTNLSLSSFKKKFREVYDDTPSNYIINQRIQKVAKLLPVSDDNISNIAYDCEFKTLAHMSRVFKTTYGVSPSQYRLNFSDKQ